MTLGPITLTPENVEAIKILTVVTVVLGTGYIWSCIRHPYKSCNTCKGKGRHFSGIFNGAYRPCHGCSGSGRRRRFGAVAIRRGEQVFRSSKFAPRTYSKRR